MIGLSRQLFLSSLLSISIGFWIVVTFPILKDTGGIDGSIISFLFFLIGGGLNVGVMPHLTAALCAVEIPSKTLKLFWFWTGLIILFSVLAIVSPAGNPFLYFVSSMQIISIISALSYLVYHLKGLRKIWWYKSLRHFIIISFLFGLFLIGDISISVFKISWLFFMDNLSIPFYFALLNLGVFRFSLIFLSQRAMIEKGRLTDDCIHSFNLSSREVEIVETLLEGLINKQIDEKLFISPKTVENHLYNIYQKVDVGSRSQLIQCLRNWDSID